MYVYVEATNLAKVKVTVLVFCRESISSKETIVILEAALKKSRRGFIQSITSIFPISCTHFN